MKLSPWSLERDIATFAYLILSAKGTAKIPGTAMAAQWLAWIIPTHGGQYGEKEESYMASPGVNAHPDDEDQQVLHGNRLEGIEDPRFSSSLSVVFLNFFHHVANSRLEGGGIAACVITGVGAPRGGI
jgi:hypothetical protein